MAKMRLKMVGKTTDEKFVLGDVFKFKDTYGIPLSVVAQVMVDNNLRVPWLELVADMRAHGIREETIKQEVKEMIDILYQELSDQQVILGRLGFV